MENSFFCAVHYSSLFVESGYDVWQVTYEISSILILRNFSVKYILLVSVNCFCILTIDANCMQIVFQS